MTEHEWLTTDDPVAMLAYLEGPPGTGMTPGTCVKSCIGERQKRLWVEACRARWPEAAGKTDLSDPTRLEQAVRNWAAVKTNADPADVAALLRDIVGNPYRPVVLPLSWVCTNCDGEGFFVRNNGERFDCRSCGGNGKACPWLTPTVLDLAHAAYDLRSGRECEECHGKGGWWRCPSCTGQWAGDVGPDCFVCMHPRLDRVECPDCNGTGRIDDGSLDPVRLAVLADALEEAGCPQEEACGECPVLRKAEVTPDGYYGRDMVQEVINWGREKRACRCKGTCRVPNPLLGHLRSPGPHVCGCWAVDLILGEE